MNTKNNLSFRNNEEKMQNALLQLLEEYDIDAITVKQICAVSSVNRSTFYSHHEDILSLLHAVENRIHQEIISTYHTVEDAGKGMIDGSFYHNFLISIKKYKTFYKASLKKRTTFPLTEGYEEIMNHLVIPACAKKGITDQVSMLYKLVFYQAGFTNILKYWVEHDCMESVDTIESYIRELIPANSFSVFSVK